MSAKLYKREPFIDSFGSSKIRNDYDGKSDDISYDDPTSNDFDETILSDNLWIHETIKHHNIKYTINQRELHEPFNDIESQYLIDHNDIRSNIELNNLNNIPYKIDKKTKKRLLNKIDTNDGNISDTQTNYIRGQLMQQKEQYKLWKQKNNITIEPEDDVLNENIKGYEVPLSEKWWNMSHDIHYEMPHQALHGGVTRNDDESDLPLNTYWHKITLSPDSWHTLKQNFREGIRPGSKLWNTVAWRSDNERKFVSSKYWPESFKVWFQRSEEELINSHDFRCKVLDHSAIDHYWEIGQMRWNRNNMKPYVRFAIWFCAPFFGLYSFIQYHYKFGVPTIKQFKREWIRWKHMMKTGEADEYYMLGNRNEMHRIDYMQAIKPQTAHANKLTDLDDLKKRTMGGYLNNISEKIADKVPY